MAAESITHIGPFPITNSLITSWIVTLFLVSFAILLNKKMKQIPGRIQGIVEMIFEALMNLIRSVTGDKKQAYFFFPFITTFFIFIILNNWIGLLPGVGTIGVYEHHHGEEVLVPFLRGGTADLNMTFALAIFSVFLTQIVGIMASGVKYGMKYINFSSPINFFVGILETISEAAKAVSFAFRLFGNIFAGEVLLVVVTGLIPLLVPLPFLFLEIFVGFVQALVFAMLTLVYMKVATIMHEAH